LITENKCDKDKKAKIKIKIKNPPPSGMDSFVSGADSVFIHFSCFSNTIR
jgi:hypothetical protein